MIVGMRSAGRIRPITFRRKRWPIASIARAPRSTLMCVRACCPKPQTIGNLQRWDFGQVKAFIKAQNAATLETDGLASDDEDAYLKGLKGGSPKKGER